MIDIPLHKSKIARIKARTNETSVPQVFVFNNADGTAHDISGYNFQLDVLKRANSNVRLFRLSIGDGLEVGGSGNNELLISVTREQASQIADTYFWKLRSTEEDHTWIAGPWEFFNGEQDAESENIPITISENGDQVTIIITQALSNSSSFNIREDYDASGDVFPSLGSGPDGIVKRFDVYPVSVGGMLDFGLGPEYVPVKSLLVAWADSPVDGTDWRIL